MRNFLRKWKRGKAKTIIGNIDENFIEKIGFPEKKASTL